MPLWTLILVLGSFLRIQYTSGGVIEARCKINCLRETQIFNSSSSSSLFEACSISDNCSSCSLPCTYEYKSKGSCASKCETSFDVEWCLESCSYLKLIHDKKDGVCPLMADMMKFDRACIEVCSQDKDCSGDKKCCFNGCGNTCQRPKFEEYPPKLSRRDVIVEENDDETSVTVRWQNRRPPDPGEVILYVVQARNHSGERFRKKDMGDWMTVVVTESTQVVVELEVGRFYQFRIAVVNANGFGGFGKETLSIKLSRNPQKPSPPENLTKGRSVIAGQLVNVEIHWDPPKSSDLKLVRYNIFYSKRPGGVSPIYVGLKEHRQVVRAPETSCELRDLEPNMKYFIQVQSVAEWGNDRKKSDRVHIFILTEQLIRPYQDDHIGPQVISQPANRELIPGPPRDMKHGVPFWENDGLNVEVTWKKPEGFEETVERFTIHWRPFLCHGLGNHSVFEDKATTHENTSSTDLSTYQATRRDASTISTRFVIFNLKFDCRYYVWVVPVTTTEILGDVGFFHFETPPCNEVAIIGLLKPTCPTAAPDLPSEPQNVNHFFILDEDSITANVTWLPPASSLNTITGYRIIWTKHRPHPSNFYRHDFPVLDKSSTRIRTVDETKRTYLLDDLEPGTRYIVAIAATNTIGGGALAVLDMKTPKVFIPTYPLPPGTLSTLVEKNPDKPPNRTHSNHDRQTTPTSSGGPPSVGLILFLLAILTSHIFITCR